MFCDYVVLCKVFYANKTSFQKDLFLSGDLSSIASDRLIDFKGNAACYSILPPNPFIPKFKLLLMMRWIKAGKVTSVFN